MPHDIVETAREAGTFQTLLTVVEAENGVIPVIDRVLIPAA
jgi:uncharacterized surface protein with fasciclin (FAS1) repeats